MHKIHLVGAFMLLGLCFPMAVAATGPETHQPAVRVAQESSLDGGPTISASRDGLPTLVWARRESSSGATEVRYARWPDWRVQSTGTISSTAPLDIAVSSGESAFAAWAPGVLTNRLLSLIKLETAGNPEPTRLAVPADAVFLPDDEGDLYIAWPERDTIESVQVRDGITSTFYLSTQADQVALALDEHDLPHLAWTTPPVNGNSAIFYAPLVEGTALTQVTPAGQSPGLAVGPTNIAHLWWFHDGDLYCADSRDWTTAQLIATGFAATPALAAAVGPAEVLHIVWVQDGQLLYANSGDWERSRVSLAAVSALAQPTIAVDPSGRVHIAWADMDGGNATWSLYYLWLGTEELQLDVTYPLAGDTLFGQEEAQVVCNLPTSEVSHVEFYLQAAPASDLDTSALIALGSDDDGRDGWSRPITIDGLSGGARYRLVAIGVDRDGRTAIAHSGWFTLESTNSPWVWLMQLGQMRLGMPQLWALASGIIESNTRLLATLAPRTPPLSSTPLVDSGNPPARSYYVGDNALARTGSRPSVWQRLILDGDDLPVGQYTVETLLNQANALIHVAEEDLQVDIETLGLPTVQVTAPQGDTIVRGALQAEAQVIDTKGHVERVSFYLERDQSILQSPHGAQAQLASMPEKRWLGSDTDGSDGWSVEVPVDASLDGDEWYVRAVAYDDQGLCASARSSAPFAVIGRERPYLYLSVPTVGATLRGVEPVRIVPLEGPQLIRSIRLYAQDSSGGLVLLGDMEQSGEHWVYSWSTETLPDGNYFLVAAIREQNGEQMLIRRGPLTLSNHTPAVLFRTPEEGETLSGATTLRLHDVSGAPPSQAVQLYYRDRDGNLRAIGNAHLNAGEWTLVWDTNTVLDGDYTLLALANDGTSSLAGSEIEVHVRNRTPQVFLLADSLPRRWSGNVQVCWLASSPLGTSLTYRLEYSPDGGSHWLAIADDLAGTCYDWNTVGYPASPNGILRVTVTDGTYFAQAQSSPHVLSNGNRAPLVTFSSPRSAETYGQKVEVAWQAWDFDGDALNLELSYRHEGEDWVAWKHSVVADGRTTWDTSELASGIYDLRITARDSAGATATDTLTGIKIVKDRAPTVQLLAPQGNLQLRHDALILWQSEDPDEDDLSIDLYYSDDAGQTWLPLAEDLPDTGYYVWQVSYLPLGALYRVRVVADDGVFEASDESSGVFSVGSNVPPHLAVLSPSAEDTLSGQQLVRWTTSDAEGSALTATLLVRRSGEVAWQSLVEELAGDGYYVWDTTRYPDGEYELRVVVSDGQSIAAASIKPLTLNNHENRPPSAELLAPRAGDALGWLREVRWQAGDPDGDVITATLSVRYEGSAVWKELATLDARVGYYLWEPSQGDAQRACALRLEVSDGHASTRAETTGLMASRTYLQMPAIHFTSPDDTGELAENHLAWQIDGANTSSLSMLLEISPDGGQSWQRLAGNLTAQGEFDLSALALEAGKTYQARLTIDDGTTQIVRTKSFRWPAAAIRAPSLSIQAPLFGNVWRGSQEIRWQVDDPLTQSLGVSIEASRDGGESWAVIAQDIETPGSYTWDTSTVANGRYLLRLTASNDQVSTVALSALFTIDNPGENAPVISVIAPCSEEVWSGTREIRWQASDPDGDRLSITLAYSTDLGASWQVIARGVANTGSYVLDTGAIPNCDRVWLRASASDGHIESYDTCDGPFSVLNPRAPLIALLSPTGGETWNGSQIISWCATTSSVRPLSVSLEASFDDGQTWEPIASDLPARGSYEWRVAGPATADRVWLRAIASDGAQSALDMIQKPVTIQRGSEPSTFIPNP